MKMYPFSSFVQKNGKLITFVICSSIFLFAPITRAEEGDFAWAANLGSTLSEEGYGIAVDSTGNVYTTGNFEDTVDFDPGLSVYNLTSAGHSDIFITKFNANGDFVWAKSMGGPDVDTARDIVVDGVGHIVTTGYFTDTVDFNPGTETYNLTSAGSVDAFICMLDANGDFVWAKALSGTSAIAGIGIATDILGNVYTTGYYQGTVDFDPGNGVYNLSSTGIDDIFISKLDKNGDFVWAKTIGSSTFDDGWHIAVDVAANVYTTGYFEGTVDFNPGVNTYNLTSAGNEDVFICKLNSDGGFVWARAMGGTDGDVGLGIAVDTSKNVYSIGVFNGTADFNPEGTKTYNLTSAGGGDVFISKLDANGNFVWARAMNGPAPDYGNQITLDSSGNIYSVGWFQDTVDFDPGVDSYNLTSAGGPDIFVSKLDNEGNFIWAKAMGGTQGEQGEDISVDASGNVYTTGEFYNTADFDPGIGTHNLTSSGSSDVFISKLAGPDIFPWTMFLPAMTNKIKP